MNQKNNLERLTNTIQETNQFFINRVQKQVNVAMTLRNWIIGCHIVEYEQSGEDRAEYGKKVLETVAVRLKEKGIKGIAETNLKWPLLVDENREMYHRYDMLDASFWDLWGPRNLWVYLKELLKGQKLHKPSNDVHQRGGDVLIDPNGIVRLHHVGTGPADRPSVEEILKRVSIAVPITRN